MEVDSCGTIKALCPRVLVPAGRRQEFKLLSNSELEYAQGGASAAKGNPLHRVAAGSQQGRWCASPFSSAAGMGMCSKRKV